MRAWFGCSILPLIIVLGCKAGSPTTTEPEPEATGDVPVAVGQASPLTGLVDEATFKALHQLTDAEAPPLHGETIPLAGGQAYLSLPPNRGTAGEPLPAVVVIHEWWGLNDHIRHWADRLADDGYAALAVDLYAGQAATAPEGAMSLMKQVDEAAALDTLAAAHELLATDPRVQASAQGVIGWCFGGGWSLRDAIAHADQLDAVVLYYGHPVTDPAGLATIDDPVLGVFANQDQAIPPATVDAFAAAMQEAGKSIEILRYDALHAFANPSNAKYDEAAAADAWAHVREFLATHLRGGEADEG